MKFKHKIVFVFLVLLSLFLAVILFPYMNNSAVLDPRGIIGLKEQNLIWIATLLMLIVVIPVLIMTFFICLRYRSSNKNAEYEPNWNHDNLAEAIWWGFPCLIVLLLSLVTYVSTYSLDPYKPFPTGVKPVQIQAVALQWRWLFIYPEQKIATINYIQFPEQTPLNFEITADAPMNSFWIPDLGGQIYAMPGMVTKLHLMADQQGEFRGSSANLSGKGFANMFFTAKSGSLEEFDAWVNKVSSSAKTLDINEYIALAKPTNDSPQEFYSLKDLDLFDQIVMQYMMPNHPLATDTAVGNN